MGRIKALLIAEACNPEWVSVPLVGWSHARAISKLTDAHLVTQIRNRDAIVRAGLVEGRDFTAIDSEAVAMRISKISRALAGGRGKGWTTIMALSALSYPYFEHLVWKKFGRRIRNGEFDVVHRLTPLSPTLSSTIAEKCALAGVPFILGPLNGGVPWPRGFDSARRKEKEWLSYLRDAYKIIPGFHSTRRNSAAILIASRDTWRQTPATYHGKSFYVPENAIEPRNFTARRTRRASLPIKAVFLGRLVPYKGADMLIEAAAPLVKQGLAKLDIIGDGPMMPELRAMVDRERIAEGVTFAGWVPHAKLQDRLVESDVFAFPSIREFGGAVALEAMAVGVVPIVIDYGGPGELVTESTGYLIPMGPRAQIIGRYRQLLSDLAQHPEQIDAKSPRAIRRAHEQFTWDAKAQQVLEIYRWACDPSLPKPHFGMPLPDLDGPAG